MAWSRISTFTDPSACQTIFQTADVELFPTAKGSFHAEVTQIGINRLLIHRVRISLPEVNTVALKHGRKSIGFLTEPNSAPLRHCGFEVLPGDIVVNRSDVAHQRSGDNFHYGAMSLPNDDLDAAVETIVGRELPETSHARVIRPASALMLRLLKLHKGIGQLAHDTPDILELPAVRRALENELIHVTVKCLADGAAVESTAGCRRHDTIITRFEEFLEANPPKSAQLSASRSEPFASPAKSIWAWGRSVFSPCGECTSRIAHCGARIRRSQPSLALSLIKGFGSSAVFRSPIAHCSGSRHRRRCSALQSNWKSVRVASCMSLEVARLRHVDLIAQCPLSEVTRKSFAQAEFFSV